VRTTPNAIHNIMLMCEDAVTEAAAQTSRFSHAVIQV
jgi:hypothetical protein